MASAIRIADGSFDFSGGIDSGRTTTVVSPNNPHGLPRSMLAWLTNGTVRGGGVNQRTGFQPLASLIRGTPEHDSLTPDFGLVGPMQPAILVPGATPLFQGKFLYEPQFANPYIITSIGGRIYKVLVEAPYTVTDLSAQFGLFNPATVPQAFFCQGEQFLVIQAGDGTSKVPTLPLFWDGAILRRSNGITGNISGANINELPAAGPMVYYAGRIWYAQGKSCVAGDIVDGPSGTLAYKKDDSILKVTENPLAIGGDGFRVPSNAGNITALAYTSNMDSTLGQGPLYIFTRKQVFQLVVPVNRTAWIAASSSNQPVQTVAQIKYGSTSDRCVVHVNGDLFYQSLEPSIRSLFVSTRYFQQWGNKQISRNENRILQKNNRALMPFATGIEFDNRLLQAILPVQTPVGVAFQAIVPLDFDIISSFGQEEVEPPPAWEGMYEGMDVLQLSEGDFGGLQRAFAMVHSRVDGSIQVWELTDFSQTDNGDNRVQWFFETPAYNFFKEYEMKKLSGGEIWFDNISGTVELEVQYRTDADPCWNHWFRTEFCAARTQCEDENDPFCTQYPQPTLCAGQKFPVTLPDPPLPKCATMNKRPVTIGYQFQMKVIIKGWCRVRGLILYAEQRERGVYEGLSC